MEIIYRDEVIRFEESDETWHWNDWYYPKLGLAKLHINSHVDAMTERERREIVAAIDAARNGEQGARWKKVGG